MAEKKSSIEVSQTENEVKIIIELNKVLTAKPVVVVLHNFIKFNCPPIYYESFLWGEVEEGQSICRLFKRQARIILKKKEPGLWPNILEKVERHEAYKKKVELNEIIVQNTRLNDKTRYEQYDAAKKEKLQHQIDRQMSYQDKIKEINKSCIVEQNCLTPKEESQKQSTKEKPRFKYEPPPAAPVNSPRKSGKIQIRFSDYSVPVPRRESTQSLQANQTNLNNQ